MSHDFTIPYEVGFTAYSSKTVSESDVYLFAGISGDMNRVHLNDQYMKTTDIGQRVAHGMLTFSIASAAETELLNAKFQEMEDAGISYLSAGYEHVRFIKPVLFGDTLNTSYELISVDNETKKTVGHLTVVNQRGEVVLIGDHILKFFKKTKD
ncbi:MAG: MaoC family dehydratase N-terminal domain-containing protein [Oscillospiraceae bacterium]|nr:MaoC family dehydratase N-terminal domain-containing protein [Oscillospiraceae bacterium]